jgi:hypothetical protein
VRLNADAENTTVTAAANRCGTRKQNQKQTAKAKTLADAAVESHPCAKNAQGWGTQRQKSKAVKKAKPPEFFSNLLRAS